MEKLKKYLTRDNIVVLLGIFYLFFLSKRGGDSKHKVAFILSILGLFQYYKDKFIIKEKILKINAIFGVVYVVLATLIYYFTEDKIGKNEVFLSLTYFSVIFSFLIGRLNLKRNLIDKISPLILLMTVPGILRGIKEILENVDKLLYYRIHGGGYTTIYAGEIGLYIIIGVILFFYYEKWYFKLLMLGYIGINGMIIYFCKSRNGVISVFLTLAILILCKNLKKGIVCIVVLGMILFGSLKLAENSKYISRIGNLVSIEKIEKESRVPIYIRGAKMIKENVYKGQGFYNYLNNRYVVEETGEHIIHFHNNFIELSITQGLMTCLFYFSYFTTFIIYFIKKIQFEDKIVQLYSYLALGSIVFYQAYGLFDSSIYMIKLTDLTFLFITLGVILTSKKEQN